MSFQSDEAALVDLMDREVMVTRLADRIHDCTPPQVFGVHGDWGAGKTSFLHQLFLRLAGECPQNPAWTKDHPEQGVWTAKSKKYAARTTTIWFEAWRYQREAEPVVALLHEIRTQLPLRAKALQETKKLFELSAMIRPKHEEAIEEYLRDDWSKLEGPIKEKSFDAFKKAFDEAIVSANAWHEQKDKGFIVWKLPDFPPPDLDFTPR